MRWRWPDAFKVTGLLVANAIQATLLLRCGQSQIPNRMRDWTMNIYCVSFWK
jgi:hypothetical protein